MKKYIVLCDNHGFQGRYWVKDSEVEFEDDVVPNKHFKLLPNLAAEKKAKETIAEEKAALSQIQRKELKPQPTAAEVMKSQKKASTTRVTEDF